LKKQLIITKDGSHSLFVPGLNETYHSKNGAFTEAMHVFIRNGLHFNPKQNLNILEIGFGTGLNTLLTLENLGNKKLHYTTLEPFPIAEEIYNKLNFHTFTKSDEEFFLNLHNCEWEREIKLSENFTLFKSKQSFQNFVSDRKYDIIYFDAFAPEKQTEMWTKTVFEKMYFLLKENGFLVTYCAKGVVKRTLKSVGLEVETLEGPPGKREMIRANKK
jgi:tRNA U34 5-methylaminomethyl-2-thiouridine-forming methyltransferase MnmC